MQANGVPYGRVHNIKEVFENAAVEPLLFRSQDRIGVRTYVGNASEDKVSHFLPPPHFGEHTVQILQKSLNFPQKIIQSLLEQGAIA
jgi:crotonobetainyl-CoA:carnitine CoA-transferase CaiB-like acyl-CoA transferase